MGGIAQDRKWRKRRNYGYLKYVLEKKSDEKYAKTIRIVLQAIMINPKYREMWLEWYSLHIMPKDNEELSTKSLIMFLVADGLWYAENMSSIQLSETEKQKVFEYLMKLK